MSSYKYFIGPKNPRICFVLRHLYFTFLAGKYLKYSEAKYKEDIMYNTLAQYAKLGIALSVMLLIVGCSGQNALPSNSINQNLQAEASSQNSNYSLVCSDGLGMAIFTNRQEVLAQSRNKQKPGIDLAVVTPTIVR